MKSSAGAFLTSLAVTVASISGIARAQGAADPFVPPRNSLGQPELSGAWTNATLTPVSRPLSLGTRSTYTVDELAKIEGASERLNEVGNARLDPNAPAPKAGGDIGAYDVAYLELNNSVMRVNGEPRNSLFTTPDGRPPKSKLPPRDSWITRSEGGAEDASGAPVTIGKNGEVVARSSQEGLWLQTDNPEQLSAGTRCLASTRRPLAPPMLPTGYYSSNYQIVQTKDHVVIAAEMVHDTRIIKLTDREHRPASIRPWFGDSVGWYEGDTLVVETTSFPKAQDLLGSWESLKVVEKFRRVPGNRLHYEFTITDPAAWDQPWGGEYEFSELKAEIYEYACHEGNYAMANMLGGSRAHDRQLAAEQQAKKLPKKSK